MKAVTNYDSVRLSKVLTKKERKIFVFLQESKNNAYNLRYMYVRLELSARHCIFFT